MPVRLTRLELNGVDRTALIDFVRRDNFPFYAHSRTPLKDIEERIDVGTFRDEDIDQSPKIECSCPPS